MSDFLIQYPTVRFGMPDGAHLVIASRKPAMGGTAAVDLADFLISVAERMLYPVEPGRVGSHLRPEGMTSWAFVTGKDERGVGIDYVVLLNAPRGISLLDALYQIEKAEGGMPAIFLAPFAYLAFLHRSGRIDLSRLPDIGEESLYGLWFLTAMLTGHTKKWRERAKPMERDEAARKLLPVIWRAESREDVLKAIGDLSFGGTDTVLIVLRLSEILWEESAIPREHPAPVGFLAADWISRITRWNEDWRAFWDVVRTVRAGRPAPPADWNPSVRRFLRGLEVMMGVEQAFEPELSRGLWKALMRVAAEEARFVPAGRFLIYPPEFPPLMKLGVTAIRVAADENGLWVQFVGDDNRGDVFRFDRLLPPRPDLEADPLAGTIAAAVWHDLSVASSVPKRRLSVGREEKERPASAAEGEEPEAVTVLVPGGRPILLPMAFRLVSAEKGKAEVEVEWGGPEERRFLRTAHFVRGHRRRLPEGHRPSAKALRRAEAFGFVLPGGFTFVSPHQRGVRKEEEGKEISIPRERSAVARGLRSLFLLVGEGKSTA